MEKTNDIPVIRRWRLEFVERTPQTLREKCEKEIIRTARGLLGSGIVDVAPCYSLVGHIYGGDYPEGHEVVTHEIKSLMNISRSSRAKTVTDKDEPVLVVSTTRDEEYYLVFERVDAHI